MAFDSPASGGDPARRELLLPPAESIEMGFFSLVVNILGGNTGTSSSILALGVWV